MRDSIQGGVRVGETAARHAQITVLFLWGKGRAQSTPQHTQAHTHTHHKRIPEQASVSGSNAWDSLNSCPYILFLHNLNCQEEYGDVSAAVPNCETKHNKTKV